jgi:hypothetical protein
MGAEKTNFFPTPPDDEAQWLARQYVWYKKAFTLKAADWQSNDQGADNLHLGVYTPQNVLLYKRTLDAQALRAESPDGNLTLSLEFKTVNAAYPAVVRVCSWSVTSGWGAVMEKPW